MIVLFLAFSIPPDWVYLNAKTVQDRHTQRGIDMDNKVLDEAVEVACMAMVEASGFDVNRWPDTYLEAAQLRKVARASILAGVKVLLGEPVAWQKPSDADAVVSAEHVAWYAKSYPYRTTYGGWIPLYAPSLGEGDGR